MCRNVEEHEQGKLSLRQSAWESFPEASPWQDHPDDLFISVQSSPVASGILKEFDRNRRSSDGQALQSTYPDDEVSRGSNREVLPDGA